MKPKDSYEQLSLQETWKQAPVAKDMQFDVERKRANARECKQKKL